MQIFGFVLLSAILVVTHAADPTILDIAFSFPDANANGAWEIEELTGYAQGLEPLVSSLFEELDTNGDLRISSEEFKGFCAKLLGGIFKMNDPNSDGFVTSEELLSGDAPTVSNSGLVPLFFKILDVNKDGFLSTEDVIPQELIPLVDMFDANRDGVVGLQEYNQNNGLLGLPEAPTELVILYNKIDKNADDKFTLAEIEGFLTACLEIMDANSDGVITLDEQATVFTQAGLPRTLAERGMSRFQMSRSSDSVNQLITILDTNNDDKISQDEVNDILDYPFTSPKIGQLGVFYSQIESDSNDHIQLEPENQLTGEQALEALGRFLDNPRFN